MSIQSGVITISGNGPDVQGQKEYYLTTPSTNTSNVLVGPVLGNADFPLEPGTSPFPIQVSNLNTIKFQITPPDVLHWISKKE